MQIIEVGPMGVRSAVITLQRRGSPLRFILFPMIHLGRPEFYTAVAAEARQCQLIVAEGSATKRRRLTLSGLAYRLLRRHRRSRLVVQNLREETLGPPVVRPDLSMAEIRRRLRGLPLPAYLLSRLALGVVLPYVALSVLLFGAERFLTRSLALDDSSPSDEPPPGEHWEAVERVIVDERDALLLDALSRIHAERGTEPIDVAVIYGAGHVPAVAHGLLNRYGYQARAAHWLTVFDLDD
jgi:hypothetical protein